MNLFSALLLAAVSAWDLPQCQFAHERLRREFTAALAAKKQPSVMIDLCRKGVELLPDDPTWRYNLACSLALAKGKKTEALDTLEQAIDLGFRDDQAIAKDQDFRSLVREPRFAQLVEYAKAMQARPLVFGPFARVPATGDYGEYLALGEQNVVWDLNLGCYEALVTMQTTTNAPYTGDFYYNMDERHSCLGAKKFPGITFLGLDKEGKKRGLDLNFPNLTLRDQDGAYPPLFGNCSRAFVHGEYWRSLPRALLTTEAWRLKPIQKIYLSNQLWFYPSAGDTAPIGTNGDVFASIAPYWMTTAGRSWSDQPYLAAAITASRRLKSEVRAEILKRGLLAPTLFTLMRKNLKAVKDEAGYLTPAAHPTAMPPNGLDLARLNDAAKTLTVKAIPPLAAISVSAKPLASPPATPELTYAGLFAWAYILRSDAAPREFTIKAAGAEEFAFVQTHGADVKVKIERKGRDSARVTIDPAGLSPTNRVDITVVGRNSGTGWGAPSYVSFSRLDPSAPYSDPALTPRR